MSKEPNITDIKARSDIPMDAKFLGWLIYNPLQDDFLWKYRENHFMLNKEWTIFPDISMKFKKYRKALQLRDDLGLKGQATLVAAFDCHPGIRIGN